MADVVKIEGYNLKDKQLREDIIETKTYLGYVGDNVLGLYVDFENNIFERLGGAVGKSAGADFNTYNMYGMRNACILDDDGVVVEEYDYYGWITGHYEDGSLGQVMVRQPKFYYKVVPIRLKKITPEDDDNYIGETNTEISINSTINPVIINGSSTTISKNGAVKYNNVYYEWNGSKWIAYSQTDICGYHGVEMIYYISDDPLPGFKVHPAFINSDGDVVDCYYIGANEASLWDTSENEYRKYDSWDVTDNGHNTYTINALNTYLADAQNDKLCSIAGVKPASGEYSTQFTRPNVNQMAKNRGNRWGAINIKILSAEQLLFIIENATFCAQNIIDSNIFDTPYKTIGLCSGDSGSHNESGYTQGIGQYGHEHAGEGLLNAYYGKRLKSDGSYEEILIGNSGYEGKISVSYRFVANFYGNVISYVDGINIWGNGKMFGGQAYICDDFNYDESKKDGNYKPVGFVLPNKSNQYIKMFGYSEEFDWLFLPSKSGHGGNSIVPVGDYASVTTKLNGYKIVFHGGHWYANDMAGEFCWYFNNNVGGKGRSIGARLIYVPQLGPGPAPTSENNG